MKTSRIDCDVAIVGGGPGGSTCGALIRKYAPHLSVHLFERDAFPRDHVGESQLPPINEVLVEMECWDKVEAANFPIKIGGTYRWGQDQNLWDFEFLPLSEVIDEPRPAKYQGWRTKTAFQVERAIYDKILLDQAELFGCQIHTETKVQTVLGEAGRVSRLTLADSTEVHARYFIDASGTSGIIRRAMGVEAPPTDSLKNIAIWDYWYNASWAVEIGVGGTRIQILSLPYGWIWFIPMSPTKTSVGLVTPADTYKSMGLTPQELYLKALNEEPRVRELLEGGTSENNIRTTKDWSFVADRVSGENWFLVGEAAGFADPILSAGVTITQMGARELAYSIVALDKGELPADWIKETYNEQQRNRVMQHIRFADFWYTQNGCFTDLTVLTQKLAAESGYEMDPARAFRWFASGSFSTDGATSAVANHAISTAKYLAQLMSGQTVDWEVSKYSHFRPNLEGASKSFAAEYSSGKLERIECYRRGSRILRMTNVNQLIFGALGRTDSAVTMMNIIADHLQKYVSLEEGRERIFRIIEALEGLLLEDWLVGQAVNGHPTINMVTPREPGPLIHPNHDDIPSRKSTPLLEEETEAFLRPKAVASR